jgi:membrane-associated protein
MSELTADLMQRLQTYFAEYGGWFVFAALFLENAAFLGTVIPGAIVLVMAGWLAQQQGHGFPYAMLLAAYAGTVCGDIVSYTIGRKVGDRLLRSEKWGKGVTSLSERVRREPLLFLFCHFAAYLRMFVPMTAGVSRVPFRRWVLLDATGAALWVTSHVAVGYFLSLSGAFSSARNIATIIVSLLVLFLIVRFLKPMLLNRKRVQTEE